MSFPSTVCARSFVRLGILFAALVWVNLALGYLNVQDRYRTTCLGFIGDPMHVQAYQDLLPLLLQVLQQQLGLSFQEATSYLQRYGENYFSE